MKFVLQTTRTYYKDMGTIEKLKKLGFKFTIDDKISNNYLSPKSYYKISDTIEIEFNNLAEFMNFVNDWDGIIVSGNNIEIYNDYRE